MLCAGGLAHGQALPVVSSSVPAAARWSAPGKPPPLPTLQPVRYQPDRGVTPDDARSEYTVQVDPPGLERLARLDSDAKLQERIRQETIERVDKEQVVFPQEPVLSREVYMGRMGLWPTRQMVVEPNFVQYEKLYFEQKNFERYGWDLGPLTPLLLTSKFMVDVVTVPMKFGARPCERDANTGYPLPGDPVPLLLYPPEITTAGLTLEAATAVAVIALF